MRICIYLSLFALSFSTVFAQNPPGNNPEFKSSLEKEIHEHYQRYDIREIQNIYRNLDQDIPLSLLKLQKMLDSFYQEFPGYTNSGENLNLDMTLQRQQDPDYKINSRREASLERLKKKQTPGLIKNAPNLFELHYAMARGLAKAEKSGVLLTKNPAKAAYHFLEAFHYRILKLSPEVWIDPQRLRLLGNEQEQKDAGEYLRVSGELSRACQKYEDEKTRLFVAQDNAVPNLKDPGNNEPAYSQDKKTLENLQENIKSLEKEMLKQNEIYRSYESTYNRYSAAFLLDFAAVVESIDAVVEDREKILNAIEYYRTNYNETFRQNWKLESRKLAYIDLLEMASALDPQNPMIPFILGRQYKNSGDTALAVSSFEKALVSHENSPNKLSREELLETFNHLGGLYYTTNRYVDSAYYYEKVLSLENTPDRIFQVAKIHTEKTGNYERADVLLKNLLKEEPAPESSSAARADFLKNRFNVLSLLITVREKKEAASELLDALNQSVQIHREMETLIQNNYDALREKEKKMISSRAALNVSPDDKNLQEFYQAQQDYTDQKDTLQKLESTRKSLNFSKIYFTMAWQYEINHNIKAAVETYRTAESFGFDPDRARKEILRLQKKF